MEASRNKLPVRRNVLGWVAIGAAVTTLAGVKLASHAEQVYDALRSRSNPGTKLYEPVHYTARQFADMPGERQTVRPGDGFYNLVERTNPNADVSSTGVEADEAAFLQDRLQAREGRGELWAGDTVCVPRVPHKTPEPPIPPSARCEP